MPSRPLDRIERRILGVLVEKAKTTPDAYPMSLNALTTGCNQKSNRDPQMSLTDSEVESGIERLRQLGAIAEVQGNGRVPRYRHYMYEWLTVDKLELAVITELLLRGAQTVGELRGRAARMEPIADLATLMPVVRSLIAKGLVIALTPEGRGQIVTHALYKPEELEKVRRNLPAVPDGGSSADEDDAEPHTPTHVRVASSSGSGSSAAAAHAHTPSHSAASHSSASALLDTAAESRLRDEINSLRGDRDTLRDELDQLRSEVDQLRSDLNHLRTQLGA
ncbi:MAG: DUF480 domain-containing protein [Pirellulales bacterium]